MNRKVTYAIQIIVIIERIIVIAITGMPQLKMETRNVF